MPYVALLIKTCKEMPTPQERVITHSCVAYLHLCIFTIKNLHVFAVMSNKHIVVPSGHKTNLYVGIKLYELVS